MRKNKEIKSPIGINIGHTEKIPTGDQIVAILKAGYDYHLDQATIQAALNTYKETTSISGVSLSNNYFNMGNAEEAVTKPTL